MGNDLMRWQEEWPTTLRYPDVPVYALLDQTARRCPHRIAIVFRGMELTYGELKELSERFATALQTMGVTQGDRVALHLPNCPQFAVAYYGLLRAGAVFTPLSPLLPPPEFAAQLTDSGATTLLSLDLIYPGVQEAVGQTPVRNILTTSMADCISAVRAPFMLFGKTEIKETIDLATLVRETAPAVEPVAIDPAGDLAHIAYTGGTTGVSKGVMLTHHNVVANAMQFGSWVSGADIRLADGTLEFRYPPGVDPVRDRNLTLDHETSLVVAPWFHAMGTIAFLNTLVMAGATMVVFPSFNAQEYLDAAATYRATVMGGAPQTYVPLINLPDFDRYDLSGVRLAGSGSAPLSHAVLDRMLEAFSGVVCEAYGLSECTMVATCNPPLRKAIRYGSVGLPVADTELRVVDVASGAELPAGEEGEILIRGPQVMQGYWGRPDETAGVLSDGWLHTGDIGRRDAEGYLFITDRIKDLIIYKGYNIYPRELEEGGEVPVAFVQLKAAAAADQTEIMEFVNREVAPYKKVRELILIDAIPVSEVGKVLKRELRARLLDP